MGSDGHFRTSLSLRELASLLSVDPRKIAKKGSKNEIDPESVFLTAVLGRSSEKAKAQARRIREIRPLHGLPEWAVGDDWMQTKLPFSLNSLIHPNDDQKLVLDSIQHSALKRLRQPGAKINAVPLESIPEGEDLKSFQIHGGFLPLERLHSPQEIDP